MHEHFVLLYKCVKCGHISKRKYDCRRHTFSRGSSHLSTEEKIVNSFYRLPGNYLKPILPSLADRLAFRQEEERRRLEEVVNERHRLEESRNEQEERKMREREERQRTAYDCYRTLLQPFLGVR